MSTALVSRWPPFGLRVDCGPLTLRAIGDADLAALLALVQGGIRPEGMVPFLVPWDVGAEPARGQGFLRYHWAVRANMTPEQWNLQMVVERDGEIVGIQGFETTNYQLTRSGESGSWLGLAHQGRGTGTLMRQSLVALLFDHLAAETIESAAFIDNPYSLAVSRKVGYRENGRRRIKRADGSAAWEQRLLLSPEDFVRPPHRVHVEGAEAFAEFIGIAGADADSGEESHADPA